MTTNIRLFSALLIAVATPTPAHHGFSTEYNTDAEVEISGVVSSITWKNPHVRLNVTADAGKPTAKTWVIESNSVSNLTRMGINANLLPVGSAVKVAGNPSRINDRSLFMNHLLLPDGRELIFARTAKPRWPGIHIRNTDQLQGKIVEQDINKRPSSLFAVWTTVVNDNKSRGLLPKDSTLYPVTERARKEAASIDIINNSPLNDCKAKGMPAAIDAPYPIQFIKDGNDIKLKLEEYDAVRLIHMNTQHDDTGIAPSLMGYSTGVWQGDKLVVTTTKIDYRFLMVESLPLPVMQGPRISLVETFRLSKDRNRLDYTLAVTDPDMFTKPMTFTKYWQYQPGAKVDAYNCTK
jgi:hypothetical protein